MTIEDNCMTRADVWLVSILIHVLNHLTSLPNHPLWWVWSFHQTQWANHHLSQPYYDFVMRKQVIDLSPGCCLFFIDIFCPSMNEVSYIVINPNRKNSRWNWEGADPVVWLTRMWYWNSKLGITKPLRYIQTKRVIRSIGFTDRFVYR